MKRLTGPGANKRTQSGFLIAVTCLVCAVLFHLPESANAVPRADTKPDSITIVVTDSGLGGLSVVADVERKLRESGIFAEVNLVFFNALFDANSGYNSLPSRKSKILMFDRALRALQKHYKPDVILVACNTLSVIYRDTPFAAETSTPVVDIVRGGVELIAGCLSDDPTGKVIVFGTETTINEGVHMAALAERGVQSERVVTQSCPQLAAYIEQDVSSGTTGMLMDAYVSDALAVAGNKDCNVYVSLNCTHYGYALETWRQTFAAHGIVVSGFLDPNTTMADFFTEPKRFESHPDVVIAIRAVSMIEIPENTIASIGSCLKGISPATEEALRNYELHPDLFHWQDLFSSKTLD